MAGGAAQDPTQRARLAARIHRILETHPAQTFLADEFAEWLEHASNDGHRQQALGHIMQAYGRAFSTLSAPAAVTTEYKPVENPRVLLFTTSTAERTLETLTASQRSEEHTSELQSLMRISSAVFCLQKKKQQTTK